MFDPVKFGEAMGHAIRKAVEPLQQEIARLKMIIEATPVPVNGKDGADGQHGRDGKDCDMEAVKDMVQFFLKTIPSPAAGKDGRDGTNGVDGKDGASITFDDVQPTLVSALKGIRDEAAELINAAIKDIPIPKDGRDGKDGLKGESGEKGADGIGIAGAMIDRDGNLMATLSNGEVKNLGPVVGKDGTNGLDGIGFESFDLEYIPESHEIAIKAVAAGRSKELRHPAGGIKHGGYWREGTKAAACETWTHAGITWIAKRHTIAKPERDSADWEIFANKGRDGERGQKGIDGSPPTPIKLKN